MISQKINDESVCIIIPTYEHFDYVKKCLNSLKNNLPENVIVYPFIIDDASKGWDNFCKELPDNYLPNLVKYHFTDNDGLTRSWNCGLNYANTIKAKYTVCTNSDILFSPNWFEPLVDVLNDGITLVGPVTNAPGHCPWQSVTNFNVNVFDDKNSNIASISTMLKKQYSGYIQTTRINGFFMMAKTEEWFANKFDTETVFNPKFKLVGNEDEFQTRLSLNNKKIAFVPSSYIFHYRSVSRGDKIAFTPVSAGAYRMNKGVINARNQYISSRYRVRQKRNN